MNVRPLEDLIERYDEIYESCRKTGKPVFLTKDGEITLVVMALDDYMKFPQRMEIVEDKDEG